MCTTNVYTYVHPDGRREQYSQPTLCANSRHGQVCSSNFLFEHPAQYTGYENTSYPYMTQLPPTPQYSPAPSTPAGSYRSGDESDRSHNSSSSNKKRSSGVYVNGQKVLDLHHKERRPSSRRHERVVVVDSPPTPRTPPQTWAAPNTAPASPVANTYLVDSSRDPNNRRPVIVDERTLQPERRVQIEVVDNHRSKHTRHASDSSRDSRHSDQEEERRQRRREQRRLEEQQERLRLRIAEANAEIASRPSAPAPPAPRRASTYKRPSVEVPDREAELIEAARRLSFEEERRDEKARRIARREEKKEEEAQRQRLMERMQPRRRMSIGAGSRRQTERYEPGMYRFE
ncbi:hypothetical protein F66182_1222 [Fusarium sp. NRRL 66182]|nr:hypothetical protein F66182_1222 [Fusarium sp. NRRL 66182]